MLKLLDRSPTSTATLFVNCTKITICILIIQSLNANMADLKVDHLNNSCKNLFLSETWLETSYPDPSSFLSLLKPDIRKLRKARVWVFFRQRRNAKSKSMTQWQKYFHTMKFPQWLECIVTTPVLFHFSWKTLKNALIPRLQLTRVIPTILTQHALKAF